MGQAKVKHSSLSGARPPPRRKRTCPSDVASALSLRAAPLWQSPAPLQPPLLTARTGPAGAQTFPVLPSTGPGKRPGHGQRSLSRCAALVFCSLQFSHLVSQFMHLRRRRTQTVPEGTSIFFPGTFIFFSLSLSLSLLSQYLAPRPPLAWFPEQRRRQRKSRENEARKEERGQKGWNTFTLTTEINLFKRGKMSLMKNNAARHTATKNKNFRFRARKHSLAQTEVLQSGKETT